MWDPLPTSLEKKPSIACCCQEQIWGQAEEGVSKTWNYTAQLLCGCIYFMQLCKDVQMGVLSRCIHTAQCLCFEGPLGTPAALPLPMHHSSSSSQGTHQPQVPGIPSWQGDTLPTQSHPLHTSVEHKEAHSSSSSVSMPYAHLRTALQKALGKLEASTYPRQETLHVLLLEDCLLSSLSWRPCSSSQGPAAFGGSRHRAPHTAPTGLLPKSHPHVLQSLLELVHFCRMLAALTNGNFLMKTCFTERFPTRSDLGACVSLHTCRGHLETFVHKARCSKHVCVCLWGREGCLGKKNMREEKGNGNLNMPLL